MEISNWNGKRSDIATCLDTASNINILSLEAAKRAWTTSQAAGTEQMAAHQVEMALMLNGGSPVVLNASGGLKFDGKTCYAKVFRKGHSKGTVLPFLIANDQLRLPQGADALLSFAVMTDIFGADLSAMMSSGGDWRSPATSAHTEQAENDAEPSPREGAARN